jgi:hypothetical protein
VEDDGTGFDSGTTGDGELDHGLGLQSMQERAELSGGTFHLVSTPGKGTKILVHWPRAKVAASKAVAVLPHAGRMLRSVAKVDLNRLQDPVKVAPITQVNPVIAEIITGAQRVQ